MERLISVEINNLQEKVKLSNKRRPVYYIKDKCRIPKRFQKEGYAFNDKNRLYNIDTGEVLYKNARSKNTPRYFTISGNSIYSSNFSRHARNNIIQSIHSYLKPYLVEIGDELKDFNKYPLSMELTFKVHDKGNQTQDNDNRWIWRKCIQDTLTQLGKWPDDNNHVINSNKETTLFIPDTEIPSLKIEIYGSSN